MTNHAKTVQLSVLTLAFAISQAFRTVPAITVNGIAEDLHAGPAALALFGGVFHWSFAVLHVRPRHERVVPGPDPDRDWLRSGIHGRDRVYVAALARCALRRHFRACFGYRQRWNAVVGDALGMGHRSLVMAQRDWRPDDNVDIHAACIRIDPGKIRSAALATARTRNLGRILRTSIRPVRAPSRRASRHWLRQLRRRHYDQRPLGRADVRRALRIEPAFGGQRRAALFNFDDSRTGSGGTF